MAILVGKSRRVIPFTKAVSGRDDILALLRSFLDAEEPSAVAWLHHLWSGQQNAVTYRQLREAILTARSEDGYIAPFRWLFLDEQLQRWQDDYVKLVNTKLAPQWARAMVAASERLKQQYPGFVYSPFTESVQEYVRQHGARFVTNSVQEQKTALSALISRAAGFEALTADELSLTVRPLIGLTVQQVTANWNYFATVFNNLYIENGVGRAAARRRAGAASVKYAARQHRYRAMNIARTELAFAYNHGAYDSTKKAQLDGFIGACVKRWLTAEDERTCAVCGGLEGVAIGMDVPFDFPIRRPPYPQFHMVPPAHPSCRCAVAFEEVGEKNFKNGLQFGGERGIMGVGDGDMQVNTGGKRNEKELTNEQIDEAITYAVSLGMPVDRIYYVGYDCTAYGQNFDMLRIGTDVLPCGERKKDPNSNISLKGAVAHEIIGHREAALKNLTQKDDLLEEVQASIRAARFAPGLDSCERADLIKDAVYRLRKANIPMRIVKDKLHIKER